MSLLTPPQAYERGIALFRWPNVYDIWNTYLTKFIDRYGGKKLERARDLFEQALDGCPAKFAKSKYLCLNYIDIVCTVYSSLFYFSL